MFENKFARKTYTCFSTFCVTIFYNFKVNIIHWENQHYKNLASEQAVIWYVVLHTRNKTSELAREETQILVSVYFLCKEL